MLKNYIKSAFRNLIRNKFFSIINIFGLTIGITTCIMIFLFVFDELQYGQSHSQKEDIYRLLRGKNDWSAIAAAKTMPAIAKELSEVKSWVRLRKTANSVITYKETFYNEENIVFADSNFLTFFEWDLLIGNRDEALKNHNSIILTQEMVLKYFGDKNPIGEVVEIDNEVKVIVTGVLKRCPKHQPIDLDFLVNIEALRPLNENAFTNWDNNSFHNYMLLNEHANIDSLPIRIRRIVANARGWEDLGNQKYKLQSYQDIHLQSSRIGYDNFKRGNVSVVYSFMGVAILVLVLACFNYTNLSTVQSTKRAKEIGLRKAIGASKWQLIYLLMLEVFLLSLISITLSLIMVETLMPWFNGLTNKSLSLYSMNPILLVLYLLLFVTAISLLAGFYPSFIMSNYQPIKVLRGGSAGAFQFTNKAGLALRFKQVLIIVQLASSISLIVISVLIQSQLKYIGNKDLGMKSEQILILNNVWTDDMDVRFENIKTDLLQYPEINQVSGAFNVPGENINNWCSLRVKSEDKKSNIGCGYIFIDEDYFKVLNTKILRGRTFVKKSSYENANSCIINETAAKMMNIYDDPIGKQVFGFFDDTVRTVVGMVNDIHYKSLHEKVPPVVYRTGDNFPFYYLRMVIKTDSRNFDRSINLVKEVWNAHTPEWPIQLRIMDQAFENMYLTEKKVSKLISLFTLLAISISLLGIFGLIAFVVVSRRKEISIRKTLGATVLNIVMTIGKEFIILTAIANIIAWPIIYLISIKWLDNFTDSVSINFLWYPLSGFIVLSIVMLIVGYHSVHTANQNPVDALKCE